MDPKILQHPESRSAFEDLVKEEAEKYFTRGRAKRAWDATKKYAISCFAAT